MVLKHKAFLESLQSPATVSQSVKDLRKTSESISAPSYQKCHIIGTAIMVTAEYIKSIFSALADGDAHTFWNSVADNVSWRVTGTDNPLSGQYNSKSEFVSKTFVRLGNLMDGKLKLEVTNVLVDGDMAAVELKSIAKAKNGSDFTNEYCWICRFDQNDKIMQVRAYLDSALVKRIIDENENE